MPYKTKLTVNLRKSPYGTVLKETEILLKNPHYQKAIKFIAKDKKINEYRNMTDFLFCEVFTEWKNKCLKFYDGQEHMLKDDPNISEVEITRYDNYLTFIALPTALATYEENKEITWEDFRSTLNLVDKVIKKQIEK